MANETILEMTAVTEITGNEYLPVVQGGVNKKATVAQLARGFAQEFVLATSDPLLLQGKVLTAGTGVSVTSGAGTVTVALTGSVPPTTASYVTLGLNAGLDNERVLTAGTGLSLTDGGANSTVTVAATGNLAALSALASTGVVKRTGVNTFGAGAIDASSDISGNLQISNFNGGTGATAGSFWRGDGTWAAGPGMGTVTSVDLALPSQFAVSGNPVTTSGTLTANWNSQSANLVLASPNGSSGAPTFRALVAADLPATYVTAVSVASANGLAGTSSGGATPALTLSTSVTGVVKADGTAFSAAVAGTDYTTPTGSESLSNKTITSSTLNSSVVGGVTPAAGTFTDLTSQQGLTVGLASAVPGHIHFKNNTNTNTFTISAGAFSADFSWTLPTAQGGAGTVLTNNGAGVLSWSAASTGTVTSVSVVSANGFSGSVATATTTPAITVSTSITGVLKGNGTAISAATAGTDYLSPTAVNLGVASTTTGSEVWYNATNANTVTINSGVTSGSYSLTLPTAQASGTQVLQNNGSGVLSWVTASSGLTAAQVQALAVML